MTNISVVLSNYNGASYLAATLDSILDQDFDDYEAIIVDDASTDGSRDLINSYVDRFPERIRLVVHESNKGQAEGFNSGVLVAQGAIVALMDSDDLWYRHKLSCVWRYFELTPNCVMLQHNLHIRRGDRPTKRKFRSFLASGNVVDYSRTLAGQVPEFIPTAGLSVRRDALLRVMPIPAKFRTCADGFLTRTLMTLGSIGFVDECWGEYRVHDGNNTFGNPAFNENRYLADDLIPTLNAYYVAHEVDLRLRGGSDEAMSALVRDYVDVNKRLGAAVLKKAGIYDPLRELYRRLTGKKRLEDIKNCQRIASYRDRHRGERAFILGMGPSLKVEDLDRLAGEVTFACNKIYLAFDRTQWRPTYYSLLDVLVAQNNAEAISKLDLTMFFSRSCRRYFDKKQALWLTDLAPPVTATGARKYGFSEDAAIGVYGGFTVIYTLLQLAWYMGIREVYLLGVDFNFKFSEVDRTNETCAHGDVLMSQGEINHFHPDYRRKGETWTMPQLEKQRLAFSRARDFFEENGGKIYNASRETKLEVFERVSLDDVLANRVIESG
jgi:glycosyltransferase involved in cell wall biosynthesis